ncbi:Smr/MutS family protein [Myxococcota bacterium]|nr:Smr/MutS family protein [Myxococcota bacterium]
MDLDARTLHTLDWAAVLGRLSQHARTPRGATAALRLPLPQDRAEVIAAHDAVREAILLDGEGDAAPVGGVVDVGPSAEAAGQGRVLDPPELVDLGRSLVAMEALRHWAAERRERCPRLNELAEPIRLDAELIRRLDESFDERGELSEETYPELGELRRSIRGLHDRVRSTLDNLVRGDTLAGVLQDRYITQRGDRYVLPIKAEAKRAGIGIVHDTSGSGETVFIEPAEIVELNNKIRELEGQLLREIARILRALSSLVGRFAGPILTALDATTAIDLVHARMKLGQELRGHLPIVGREGVIALKEARHPVLQLRGVAVVPNDLRLDPDRPGLVLSGPNTGGKTVALKTLGLAALLCRAAVPIPAQEGSRCDVFPDVIADIGDLQTVEGDLSTFSGHILVLKEVLRRARPGALVLLDEVAVGTDPTQGAALARAVLEEVVDRGARVGVTTHYTDLKAFASSDPRFRSGAVQLENGRPTYKVRADAVGTSHAFSTARRLGLDPTLIDRAEALMSEEARMVGGLLDRLEGQRAEVDRLERTLRHREEQVAQKEQDLAERWERIRGKSDELARKEATRTLERLREAEEQARALIAALQRDPNLRLAGRSLQSLKDLRDQAAAAPPPLVVPREEPAPQTLSVGDRVRVRSLGGAIGRVTDTPKKGQVEVEVGKLKSRVALSELIALDAAGRERPVAEAKAEPKAEPRPEPSRAPVGRASTGDESVAGIRMASNTCDLRGKRVDEALEEVGSFLDRMVAQGQSSAYLLHGHGTGAIKKALREWLPRAPHVAAWRPANEGEGGDAFTVVRL